MPLVTFRVTRTRLEVQYVTLPIAPGASDAYAESAAKNAAATAGKWEFVEQVPKTEAERIASFTVLP